ncbi:hypothetical protein FRC09_002564, partial [Ceratobasidium sp. 395]
MRSLSALSTLGIAASLVVADTASPPVKVSLTTSWAAPSLLLEIIETAASEHPDQYFEIVEALTDPSTSGLLGPLTDTVHKPKYVYHTALALLQARGFLTEPSALSSYDKSLALHSAAPKIQAFYQLFGDASRPAECGSWVEWAGKQVCGPEEIEHLLKDASSSSFIRLFSFDHVQKQPDVECSTPVVFYASLSSQNFYPLHSYLRSQAAQSDFCYVMRYVPPENAPVLEEKDRNFLSGYGVALDLKKMDYLALDDRGPRGQGNEGAKESTEENAWQDHVSTLLAEHPHEELDLTTPLTNEEIASLPYLAAHLVTTSKEPLKALAHLSQNFPKHAVSLARRWDANRTEELSTKYENIESEVQANMHMVAGAGNMAWLNGVQLSEDDMNPFSLLRLIRRERQVMSSLMNTGLTSQQAIQVLANGAIGRAATKSSTTDSIFDASDRLEGGKAIVWLNDIEKDQRYARWSPSLTALFRQLYPGQFPTIRRNMLNIVLALDFSRTSSLSFIAGPVNNIISRNLPFRFGYVPLLESAESRQAARLMTFMMENYGYEKTAQFLSTVITPTDWVNARVLESSYANFIAQYPPTSGSAPAFETFSADPLQIQMIGHKFAPEPELQPAVDYAERLSLTANSGTGKGHVFINGKHFDYDDTFLRNLQNEMGTQISFFQEQLYTGALVDTEETDISVFMYDLPTTAKRRNKFINPSGNLKVYALDNLFSAAGATKQIKEAFVYPSGDHAVPLSIWVVGDMDSSETQTLFIQALRGMGEGAKYRLGYIHSTGTEPSAHPSTSRPLISPLLARLSASESYAQFPSSELVEILEEAKSLASGDPDLYAQGSPGMVNLNGRLTGVTTEGVDADEFKRTLLAGNALAKAVGLKP